MTLFVKTGVGEWTQLFLMQTIGKSQYDSSIAMSFLEIGGLFGSIASGYVTDKLVQKSEQHLQEFPLTTISKSYDWGAVFIALELASLFCGCLLIGARNVSRHMIDPSKLE
ncbi:hypothetical protein OS493_038573 [Desmophyllum pertusum]|uniref:Uncharacterized protein n=1 Tax=Desmophyllum pertusum TaxID=174260 RepID=A0A9W9Y6Z2_9CNID|nr:hypothetical protein OS493_038573 [Desmophyllum pertusum]